MDPKENSDLALPLNQLRLGVADRVADPNEDSVVVDLIGLETLGPLDIDGLPGRGSVVEHAMFAPGLAWATGLKDWAGPSGSTYS